ncbi:MAG TPA: hypothetical protein V6C72_07040, partial [Chroococcales cyanobacterium]
SRDLSSGYTTAIILVAAGVMAASTQFFISHSQAFSIRSAPSDWEHVLRNLFMPINRARWTKYAAEYRYLYFTLLPILFLSFVSAARNRLCLKILLFALAWMFVGVLPFVGEATHNYELYGMRWLYCASVPLSLLTAQGALAPCLLIPIVRAVTIPAAALLCLLVAIFDFRHTHNQTESYRVAGKILRNIQHSAKIICQRENAPLLLVRDLPTYVSLVPTISPFHVVALDAKTGMIRAFQIPGGPLKDCLRSGRYRSTTLRWEERFHMLMSVELTPEKNQFGTDKDAAQIAAITEPPLKYYSTMSFDPDADLISMQSNSQSGPALNLKVWGLSPLDGDFFYTDALIKAPAGQAGDVELHWLTNLHNDHEHDDRRTWTPAFANDGKVHRYFLSLRSTGFTTNGPVTIATLGFPAGSRTDLKAIGVVSSRGLIPTFLVRNKAGTGSSEAPAPDIDMGEEGGSSQNGRYQQLCYNYPDLPELGLFNMSQVDAELECRYDVSMIENASSAICQITPLTDQLIAENGVQFDRKQGTCIENRSKAGTIAIHMDNFSRPGFYRIRLISLDESGNVVGRFSDSIYVMVNR